MRFDQEEDDRVLLMDIHEAAHGLNIAAASRIYFVNPTCRPNIEAQAIKRAHRIGQTKPVYVETLVLRGTIEERMLERSNRMTSSEHRDASHLEDDIGMREIIQGARVLQISADESTSCGQMAPLEEPQQLWCREGYETFSQMPASHPAPEKKRKWDDVKSEDDTAENPLRSDPKARSVVRKTLAFVDCSEGYEDGNNYERPTTPESPGLTRRPEFEGPSPLRLQGDPVMPVMGGYRLTAASVVGTEASQTMNHDLYSNTISGERGSSPSITMLDRPGTSGTSPEQRRHSILQTILRLL